MNLFLSITMLLCITYLPTTWSRYSFRLDTDNAPDLLDQLNVRLFFSQSYLNSAKWTFDTNLNSQTQGLYIDAFGDYVQVRKELTNYVRLLDQSGVDEDTQRQLDIVSEPGIDALGQRQAKELQQVVSDMTWNASTAQACVGSFCIRPNYYLDDYYNDDPNTLKVLWAELAEKTATKLRSKYLRHLELGQRAAQMNGLANYDKLFTAHYQDMDIGHTTQRLWSQVRPLYIKLHAYLRDQLHSNALYPDVHLPDDGTIPEHLFHVNKMSLLIPNPATSPSNSLAQITTTIQAKHLNVMDLVDMGESTYRSLGWPALSADFRQNSQFVAPFNHEAVCHYQVVDFFLHGVTRLQQCAKATRSGFTYTQQTLGRNYYRTFYEKQPQVYRQPANGAFDHAIGKVISISSNSVSGWKRRGLIPDTVDVNDPQTLITNQVIEGLTILRRLAIDYVVDQWRHEVFQGRVKRGDLNRRYWELMVSTIGVSPPLNRSENVLDALLNWHVPANQPTDTHFVAQILAFQIHKTLCSLTQPAVPLNLCDITGYSIAGDHLKKIMEQGNSRHWHGLLEELVGSGELSADAMLQYFAPLSTFLDTHLRKKHIGWHAPNVDQYISISPLY